MATIPGRHIRIKEIDGHLAVVEAPTDRVVFWIAEADLTINAGPGDPVTIKAEFFATREPPLARSGE